MNEIIKKDGVSVENMIYEVRGKQVMLDSDLAKLYNCVNGTKTINLAVKRNIERFPEDFYFQLNEEEFTQTCSFNLKPQKSKIRSLPYVFTEQGVAMLSSVLHTSVAADVSVQIMRAFVAMRHYISNNLLEQRYINNMVLLNNEQISKNTNDIKKIQETLNNFKEEKEVNEIYFDGKIYDAYSKIIDIFKEAKEELIIVDRYTDKTILDMIKDLECNIILITSKNTKLTKLDIEKYNKTYHNLTIYYNDEFHDRYFIIDNKKIYHSGNSINHIGYRKSSIDVLSDSNLKRTILNDIKKIVLN